MQRKGVGDDDGEAALQPRIVRGRRRQRASGCAWPGAVRDRMTGGDRPLEIVGFGRYLPTRVVTNEELERACCLQPGWIERHTGVRERRWAGPHESNSVMGAAAARAAAADAGLGIEDFDLILCAAGTPEQSIPDNSALIHRELGLGQSGVAAMSVNLTCLSFLAALDLAASMLAEDRYRMILVVTSDITSVGLSLKDPASATLFGDAAAAVAVTRTPAGESSRLQEVRFETYGAAADLIEVRGGGSRRHPDNPAMSREDNFVSLNGQRIYRMARRYQNGFLDRLRKGLATSPGSIRLAIPHQASGHSLRALRRNGFRDEQIVVTLDRFGNCAASSLPLTLHEAVLSGRARRGDELLLAGVGAGVTFGGVILTL
ncbi:MAG: ketoacyl-ACP synthase III [Bauldia sp.]|nr:ketoacyl-ACP synthase III [Bauldia sp.]